MSQRTKKLCSVDACGRIHKARGYCDKHYRQWKKTSDPLYREPLVGERACAVNGCGESVYKVDWCNRHYIRKRRHGSPTAGGDYVFEGTSEERFWAKVRKTDGCWEWQGYRNKLGYGRIRSNGKHWNAHRLAWTLIHGDISDDLVIDHICHNPSCVKPSHLRPATHKQNMENLNPKIWDSRKLPRGVYQDKRDGRFYARTKHQGHSLSAGGFDCVEDAEKAAIELRRKVFTHNSSDWHPIDPAKVVANND